MIRGAQKQLIVVKTEGNPLFDEAYFVLRKNPKSRPLKKEEILKEAEKVLEASETGATPVRSRLPRAFFFFLGMFFGALWEICRILFPKIASIL